MNEEQKYKVEQYDKHFKEMKDIIEKVKQIVDIYYNTKGEFATLPNGEEICLSDNAPVLEYLQELIKEEN